MATRIAISGATGALGSMASKELGAKGLPLRLLVRNKNSNETANASANCEVVEYKGYHDVQDCVRVLKNCDVCYMVSGKEDPDVSLVLT